MVWLLTPFAVWGLIDLYMFYRFARKPQIDKTASVTWWIALKWSFTSQTQTMVTKLPWLSQDLTEALGIRPDDGKVS